MKTVTVKINERSRKGKASYELLRQFQSKKNGIEIVEEKSPYSPAFVKKIKKSQAQIKQGKYTVINPDDIRGSLGL